MGRLLTLEIQQIDKLLSSKNIFSNQEIGRIQDLISWLEAVIENQKEELSEIRENYFDVRRNY